MAMLVEFENRVTERRGARAVNGPNPPVPEQLDRGVVILWERFRGEPAIALGDEIAELQPQSGGRPGREYDGRHGRHGHQSPFPSN
jgi:hypothetical protein